MQKVLCTPCYISIVTCIGITLYSIIMNTGVRVREGKRVREG